MSKINDYVNNIIAIANDNTHGYSQVNRWGVDYDCSSLVITVVQNSGIPVKNNGATYTGNMLEVFKKCGFTDVKNKVNFATGSGLQYGDILLNTYHHTEIYIGNGKVCGAHSNYDGKTGDSSGKEINIKNYYNYPWYHCLRYTKETAETNDSGNDTKVTKSVKATGVADSFSKTYKGTYKTTTSLNLRNDGNTKSKILVTMPENTRVVCYGYYDKHKTNWLYVVAVVGNTEYTGFCSSAYLTKV